MPTGLRWGNLREGDHFKDAGIGRRIILKWISVKYDGGVYWIYLAQGRGQVAISCECGSEPSAAVKCGMFVD